MTMTALVVLVVIWLVAVLFFKTIRIALKLLVLLLVVAAVIWFMDGGRI